MNMIYFVIMAFILSMMAGLVYICMMYEKSRKLFMKEQRRLRLQKAAEYNRNTANVVKWTGE